MKCEICGMPAGHRLLDLNVCRRCLGTYQPECPACGGRMIARRYGREIVFDCTRCDVRALKSLGHTGANPPARDELLRWVQATQLQSPDWDPRRVLCTGVLPISDDPVFIETMVSIHTTRDSIAVGLWPDTRVDMPVSDDAIYVDMPMSAEARRHLHGLYAWNESSDWPENLRRVADIGIDNAVAEAIACVSYVTLEREGAELRVTLAVGGAMEDDEIAVSEAFGFNTDVFELTALIPLDAVADVLRASPMITIQVRPLAPRGVQANPRPRRRRRRERPQ